ncbi:hypothetical protein GPALN_003515 [Globodera pallida]|nr:hypothetical protein GPALN_003515 [Globodera pallida]
MPKIGANCSPFTASTSASSESEVERREDENGNGRAFGEEPFGGPVLFSAPPPFSSLIRQILLLLPFLPSFVEGRLLDTSVACDQHNFLLSLNFDVPFRGLVYSEEGFPNCVYVNGTMLSHINYHLKIPLHGCETHNNADGNFENGIIIQDNVAFLQSTDKKYLLTCIPSPPAIPSKAFSSSQKPLADETTKKTDPPPLEQIAAFGRENTVAVDFGGVSVDQSFSSTQRTAEGAILPHSLAAGIENSLDAFLSSPSVPPATPELKYTVEIRAGHSTNAPPINAALNIGDKISYVVRLQKPVSESQIGRCWASDSKSSLELSDEHGCSLQPRGNIWGQFERTETDSDLIFINRIKAWAFPTSNEVNIFCNLRVCMSRLCSFQTNCSATDDENSHERMRRRVDGEFSEVETIKTRLHVRPKRKSEGSESFNTPSFASSQQSMDNENWCVSPVQLILIGACCCAVSFCLSAGAGFLLFTQFVGRDRNGKSSEEEIWSTFAGLNRHNQRAPARTDSRRKTTHSRHAI